MKPHEQSLTLETLDTTRRCLVDGDRRMVAVFRAEDASAWEQFLVAAPDMARALMALGHTDNGEWHLAACWQYSAECVKPCRDARAALRKAGVTP